MIVTALNRVQLLLSQKKMYKHLLNIILGTLACTYACAQSFCHLVQPVGTYYEDTIESAGTYYYSAWTYDLPMDVYITTSDPACSEPPQVWADLTCTPGYYSDPNIRDLVNDTALTNRYGISVPFSLGCETNFVDGHYVHHLKLGKSYRSKLQLIGIDYNVQAYVKVVLPCGGIAHMEQDTSSQACVNDARWLRLVDSTHVLAFDTLITYIFPFKDWLKETDSMALRWEGTQDARIWLAGNECEFEAKASNGNVWDIYDIPANGELHLSKERMEKAATKGTQDTAGFLFSRIVCPEEGRLFTRPLIPNLNGATLFHLNTPQEVTTSANDFYCFPTDWKNVEWIANTRKVVKMYIHTSPEAAPIDSFKFDFQDSTQRVLLWSTPEMKELRAKATEPLLFARFACSRDSFYVTPNLLDPSSCAVSAVRIRPGTTTRIGRSQILSLYYADVEGYPLEISCVNDTAMNLQNLFIADTCQFTLRWSTGATKRRCVLYKQTERGGETWTISSEDIAGWEVKRAPVDGFYYIRGTASGTITLTTAKPEEQDPEGDDPEYKPDIPTSLRPATLDTGYKKVLHHGQILIIRAGKAYTITGQPIKID